MTSDEKNRARQPAGDSAPGLSVTHRCGSILFKTFHFVLIFFLYFALKFAAMNGVVIVFSFEPLKDLLGYSIGYDYDYLWREATAASYGIISRSTQSVIV